MYFVDHQISSSATLRQLNAPASGSSTQVPVYSSTRRTLLPAPSTTGGRFVSAPASQAYVRRVFSVCGDLCCRKRNRATKCLERHVFLKMNRKLLYLLRTFCELICGLVGCVNLAHRNWRFDCLWIYHSACHD